MKSVCRSCDIDKREHADREAKKDGLKRKVQLLADDPASVAIFQDISLADTLS